MDIFIQWVKHAIKSYGYLGVFGSQMLGRFGLPVPDETILAFTGFLVYKNYLHPAPALLAAYLGSICGITLNYLVGRFVDFPLLCKYGYYLRPTDERINQAHRWFEKYGKFALFMGYFLPGLRHLTALSGLPAWNIAILLLTPTPAAVAGWSLSLPWAISWGRSGARSFPKFGHISGWRWAWLF